MQSSRAQALVGDVCKSCHHPFIRCFITFDVLPLIEFKNGSLSDQEALSSICKYPPPYGHTNDSFNESINNALRNTDRMGHVPVEVDQKVLESFNRKEIFTLGTISSGRMRFFKNMIPEIGIAVCNECLNFFNEEDYEYEFLKQDACPFCGSKNCGNVSIYAYIEIILACHRLWAHFLLHSTGMFSHCD